MSSPYQSPLSEQFYNQARQSLEAERQRAIAAVQAPAIAWLIASGLGIAGAALWALYSLLLLAAEREHGPAVLILFALRMGWGVGMLAGSSYCLYGAWQMKTLNNYQHAWIASIVALVPCTGPCCLLGVPFGAWALTVLVRPEVRERFQT